MEPSAAALEAALVREYLHRHGLHDALAVFDSECPRGEDDICTTPALERALHMRRSALLNRKRGSPLKSLLDVMVKYYYDMDDRRSQRHRRATGAWSAPVADGGKEDDSRARTTAEAVVASVPTLDELSAMDDDALMEYVRRSEA
eukprot:PLAT3640.5.p1 GENE.PLAT3640.5~~PLAT3640.5.p1  ORF type:complete len:161 (+),score=68.28 PLAT3640.5:50-484(+)